MNFDFGTWVINNLPIIFFLGMGVGLGTLTFAYALDNSFPEEHFIADGDYNFQTIGWNDSNSNHLVLTQPIISAGVEIKNIDYNKCNYGCMQVGTETCLINNVGDENCFVFDGNNWGEKK